MGARDERNPAGGPGLERAHRKCQSTQSKCTNLTAGLLPSRQRKVCQRRKNRVTECPPTQTEQPQSVRPSGAGAREVAL